MTFFQPPAHPNPHSTTLPIKLNEQLPDLIPNPNPHAALNLTIALMGRTIWLMKVIPYLDLMGITIWLMKVIIYYYHSISYDCMMNAL
jgi:hypothetical protein